MPMEITIKENFKTVKKMDLEYTSLIQGLIFRENSKMISSMAKEF